MTKPGEVVWDMHVPLAEQIAHYRAHPPPGGDPELAGREHDLYSWFTLLARDPATKQLEQLYELECA